jgi:hypothetical protein
MISGGRPGLLTGPAPPPTSQVTIYGWSTRPPAAILALTQLVDHLTMGGRRERQGRSWPTTLEQTVAATGLPDEPVGWLVDVWELPRP